jgi:Superfamily II DNA and RNA helicases
MTLTNFEQLGLSKNILKTLVQLGFTTPTPIQEKGIPVVLEGRDLIGLAQTGTGKTAAFGLPIMEMLMTNGQRPQSRSTRVLILAPTRELVNQIGDNLRAFGRKLPLKIVQVVGGASINKQQQQLLPGTDILVATPGRLIDLIERNAVTLQHVSHLVLDEADQMLDLGFIHALRRIAKLVPPKRQTLLFSATMPKQIADLAGNYLTDPVKVQVTPPGRTADKIEQYVHFARGQQHKTELLKEQLAANPDGRSIVFLRTKHGAEKLMKHLALTGFSVASIHGNKSQNQREKALKGFRDGEIQTLIATDVAARGIDIPEVSHVYNYDLPEVPDAYVHRIGRTARAGRGGIAIAFCGPDEGQLLRDIERLIGVEITVAGGEPHATLERPVRNSGGRRGNGGGNNRNHSKGSGEARKASNGGNRQGEAKRGDGAKPSGPRREHTRGEGARPGPRRRNRNKGNRPAGQAASGGAR